MKKLETIHRELEELFERVRHLTYGVFQYNPAFEENDKPSLIKLGVEARSIGNAFETIGVHLINAHEEEQRNENNGNDDL